MNSDRATEGEDLLSSIKRIICDSQSESVTPEGQAPNAPRDSSISASAARVSVHPSPPARPTAAPTVPSREPFVLNSHIQVGRHGASAHGASAAATNNVVATRIDPANTAPQTGPTLVAGSAGPLVLGSHALDLDKSLYQLEDEIVEEKSLEENLEDFFHEHIAPDPALVSPSHPAPAQPTPARPAPVKTAPVKTASVEPLDRNPARARPADAKTHELSKAALPLRDYESIVKQEAAAELKFLQGQLAPLRGMVFNQKPQNKQEAPQPLDAVKAAQSAMNTPAASDIAPKNAAPKKPRVVVVHGKGAQTAQPTGDKQGAKLDKATLDQVRAAVQNQNPAPKEPTQTKTGLETEISNAEIEFLLNQPKFKEMVAQIILQELRGDVGEKISVAMRKFVRREIRRSSLAL